MNLRPHFGVALLVVASACVSPGPKNAPEQPSAQIGDAKAQPVVDIWSAIDEGNLDLVRRLVVNGQLDVNSRQASGKTLLMESVSGNQPQIAAFLLDHGSAVNAIDSDGYTALHRAALQGSKQITKLLLANGADPNVATFKGGGTPLMMAAAADHLSISEALLAAGAAVDAKTPQEDTALYFAAFNRYTEITDLLLRHGADKSAEHRALLHVGAQDGHEGEVLQALQDGAAIDSFCPVGLNALMLAAEAGNLSVLKLLIERGANLELHGADGNTALHIAASKNQLEAVRLLVSAGASVDSQNVDGLSPLELARSSGQVDTARFLERNEKPRFGN